MEADGRQLAFVVGHYKSGTTWLVNLLSLHPDLRGLAETHVLRYALESGPRATTEALFEKVSWSGGGRGQLPRHRVAKWTRPLRKALGMARGQSSLSAAERPTNVHDLALWDQGAIRRKLLACSSADETIRTFYSFVFDRLRPRAYLVDKTPTNVPYVPKIRELFPKAKLIVIHRDGRDVVVSDKFHLKRTYDKAEAFEERVLKWRRAMELEAEYVGPYGIFQTSYEDMKERPREIVGKLMDFLQLPTSETVLEDMIHRSSFEFITGRREGQEDAGGFYRKGVAGDWINHYSDDEKERFGRLAGDLLVQFGYESSADWKDWGAPTAPPAAPAAADGGR
jgi:hypothetical protein